MAAEGKIGIKASGSTGSNHPYVSNGVENKNLVIGARQKPGIWITRPRGSVSVWRDDDLEIGAHIHAYIDPGNHRSQGTLSEVEGIWPGLERRRTERGAPIEREGCGEERIGTKALG